MDLEQAKPGGCSAQELAALLFRQGKSLLGKNLRKSSWKEIASVVCGNNVSSEVIWTLLRNAKTRNEAIKILRLARKQVRHKISIRQIRGQADRRSAWRFDHDVVNSILDDDYSESYLEICHHCHRSHCLWAQVHSIEDEDHDVWWQSLDAHLSDLVACRSPLIPTGIFPQMHLPETENGTRIASIGLPAKRPVEDRLLDYIVCFANNDQDIRSLLSQSIHDAGFIARWLEEAYPYCHVRNVTKLVCLFAPFWVRSPSNFVPGNNASLFDHLFSLYRVPQFLKAEWLKGFKIGNTHRELKWLYWHILLGQGAGLKRAAAKFGWKVFGYFQQYWEQFPYYAPPVHACIYAQVKHFGGTEADFHRVICNPAYVVDPTDPSIDTSFWRDAVRWLVIHGRQLNDQEADLILTWAMHEFTERPPLHQVSFWKGRTAPAALERSREYHRLMARPWSALTWPGHDWDWSIDDNPAERWSFLELTSGEDLYLEGSALHHCVVTYAQRCASGSSAIVSMRRNGERCLTLEINLQQRQIVQARGLCNRTATKEEERVIRRWFQHLLFGES